MSEPSWELLGGGGAVGGPIDYIGAWSAGVTYQPGQIVRYNGVDYLAVNPSLGQTPPAAQGIPSAALVKIFDIVVGRGQPGDPASGALIIDSNTILGGPIPQIYKHLWFLGDLRSSLAATFDNGYIRFNNDASAIYDYATEYAQNGTAASVGATANGTQSHFAYIIANTSGANKFHHVDGKILNYLDTLHYQNLLVDHGFFDAGANYLFGKNMIVYKALAAISRIQWMLNNLGAAGQSFMDGSSMTLYGMAA